MFGLLDEQSNLINKLKFDYLYLLLNLSQDVLIIVVLCISRKSTCSF